MKSIGAKDTIEEIYKNLGKPTIYVASETDGRNMYVVLIESFYRGRQIDNELYLIIFKNNVREANSYISWYTDGEIENTEIAKAGLRHFGAEEYLDVVSQVKSYGKILEERKGFSKQDFLNKFGDKIHFHITNEP